MMIRRHVSTALQFAIIARVAVSLQAASPEVVQEVQHLLHRLARPGGHSDDVNFKGIARRLRRDDSTASKCALAELHLFGVPSRDGNLDFPGGFPRNLSAAIALVKEGVKTRDCGRCFFLLGVLLALGEPSMSSAAHFHVLANGGIEFALLEAGVVEEPGIDRTALAYYVGAELHDPLAALALAQYIDSGLTLGHTSDAWWLGSDESVAVLAVQRTPQILPAVVNLTWCKRGLKFLFPVADAAASDEPLQFAVESDLNFHVDSAIEIRRRKKEHSDWVTVRSQDQHSNDEVARAAYLIHGDSDIDIAKNLSEALTLLNAAAVKGNIEATWTAMLLYAREERIPELARCAASIISNNDASKVQKVVAQYYVHRFGFGVKPNATVAGVYLLLAATLGDGNAQQLVAHGFAGVDIPDLRDVVIPGAPSDVQALHYYKLAAKQGRPVSAINAVSLIMQGRGGGNLSASKACQLTSETYRNVALSYHPDVLQLHAHGRRSFYQTDVDGALLRFVVLSELGAKAAHANAAALWAQRERHEGLQCWRLSAPPDAHACEFDYLRRAALFSGDVGAMLRLSAAYAHGTMQDEVLAFHWASQAAAAGSAHGMYTVAYSREHGIGALKDLDAACTMYCSIVQNTDESWLARTIALLRTLKIRSFTDSDCCVLSGLNRQALIAVAISTVCLLVAFISTCLG